MNITQHRNTRTIAASLIAATTLIATSLSASAMPKYPMEVVSSQPTATKVALKKPMMGSFVTSEKSTTGTARIVEEGGHRYLELSSDFATNDQGPDLHVLLDTAANAPQGYDANSSHRYLNLGKLEKFSGAQRYPLPDSVNAANYKSVVVWCRMANATFGYAMLK